MSDMPRPGQPSHAPDHHQHDPLLVAQAAAGDPLDPERAAQAQAWLATCPHCAALPADLHTVSMAVAAEPVPRRRRDFRLAPEQAEQLQGNALTRFLRRLSAPRAPGYAPAAAGVLSIGLLFLVVGYAWPDDATVSLHSGAEVASEPIEEPLGDVTGPPVTAAAPSSAIIIEEGAAAAPNAAARSFADEPEALEGLAEHQAGDSAASEAVEEAVEAELDQQTERSADEALDADTLRAAAKSAVDPADDAVPGGEAGLDAAADEVSAPAARDGAALVATGGEDPTDDDGLIESWLLLIGAALAVVGGLLLLLGWLARRTADPLLR